MPDRRGELKALPFESYHELECIDVRISRSIAPVTLGWRRAVA